MHLSDLEIIEDTLGFRLPEDYRIFLLSERNYDAIDEQSVIDNPNEIIGATLEYRAGFGGNKPWPAEYIYVGDEADACPYVIDCTTGKFIQSDHGNLEKPPISYFPTFGHFVDKRLEEAKIELDNENAPPLTGLKKLKNDIAFNFWYYAPLIIAFIVIFIVFPGLAYTVSEIYKYLSK